MTTAMDLHDGEKKKTMVMNKIRRKFDHLANYFKLKDALVADDNEKS
jgi:hypothetical protein